MKSERIICFTMLGSFLREVRVEFRNAILRILRVELHYLIRFLLPSKVTSHSLVWLQSVNGFFNIFFVAYFDHFP